MKTNPICRVCEIELNEENWYPSHQKRNEHICKGCSNKRVKAWRKANPEKDREYSHSWRKANPEKAKASWTRFKRKRGERPFNENKECPSFLGVHIAERVLIHVFKNVKRMPMNNPGYDVICNRDKLIDIKSACMRKNGNWEFAINHNTIADFFLCLAFDNREDLTPLHAWLLPGSKVNLRTSISIRPSTLQKWDAYALDISKISECCDMMR